jgi:RNA polymerase sigma factor (sigma-70 family)
VSDSTWALLRQIFASDYHSLRKRLTKRVGSDDLAREALQDTFLRLARGGEIADDLANPRGYLYRIAVNFARLRLRSEGRRQNHIDSDAALNAIVDDRPGPAETEEGKSDVHAMLAAIDDMPRRRREIFVLAWFEEAPHQEIASRFGLSLRMVQIELKRAREHVVERMNRNNVVDFASRRPPSSSI